jgi:hypothetical protein
MESLLLRPTNDYVISWFNVVPKINENKVAVRFLDVKVVLYVNNVQI